MRMLLHHKKGCAVTFIAVGLLLAVIIFQIVKISSRECSSDNDCSANQYCGSDFACHQFKVIETTEVKYNTAATILGTALIIAAFIVKGKKFNFKKLKFPRNLFKKKKTIMPPLQTYYEEKAPHNYSELDDPLKQEWGKHDH